MPRRPLIAITLTLAAASAACQSTPSRPAPPQPTDTRRASTPSPTTAPADPAATASSIPPGATVVLPPLDPKVSTVPPELIDALKRMSAEDFQTRVKAVNDLELAMTRQFQQMVQVQDLLLRVQQGLADQLSQMTQGAAGDSQTRVAGLMEFNGAVSRWAVDVMALPESQRESLLQWGIRPENLPLIARAYNRDPQVRAKASREIAKFTGPEADWLLVQLLNDRDREVSLTTIDAVADRPISPPILDAIWDHAVGFAMNQFRQQSTPQRTISIRGRTIVIYNQNQNPYAQQDADVAVDVLIGMKSDKVTDRLNAMFKEMAGSMTNNNDYRWRVISPNYGEGGRAISRLMEAYKPKEAVPFLLKVLNMDISDGYDTTVNNNEKVRYSSRIDAAALLLKAIGQDPDDYNIHKYSNFGDRWLLKGGQPEENTLVRKLQTWGRTHANDFATAPPPPKDDVKTPGPATPATRPGRAVRSDPGPQQVVPE
ncbi:MAG TPA: hypothetical protein VH253_02110 [Phycisphaerae bacterium]|nr:hypothetical protein [Phycisphaerae bacterium]